MDKITQIILLGFMSIFLSACGGGSSGSGTTTPPPPVNVAPTANAGVEQGVDEGLTVTLSGTGSDSDGSISSYSWTQTAGSAVTISDADSATASFEAPTTGSDASIALTFRLTVTDDDGATGTDSTVITVNSTNISPVANAGINQTVDEQSVVTLDGTASSDSDGSIASYNWMQLTGAGVSIADPASATTTFDAPSLSSSENITFRLTVTDDRDVTSIDDVTITVNPVAALNEAPLADAGPAQTVASGDTVILDGGLSTDSDGTIDSYVWAQLSGTPTVTLSNPNTATPTFDAPTVTANTVLSFIVTVTDNEGAIGDDFVEITITPQPTAVTISGKATFDNVPHNTNSSLNYTAITQDPIRSALVELIMGTNTIVDSSLTDLNGNYSFEVDPNSGSYFVRVKSHSLSTGTATWDVSVVDNTNSQALYALDGSSFTVAVTNIARPTMNASTVWNGSTYTSRAGAPFHILDRIVAGNLKLQGADASVILPAVDVNWSPSNNLSVSDSSTNAAYLASLRAGDVGTSFYTTFPNLTEFAEFTGPQIFVLGSENSDTDEYDGHIIVHEWGHYFENNLSRSDSIGGAHSGGDRLDMRLAFGEGFGNAWSGIITDDSFYRDSFGVTQSQGFSINVETNSVTNEGWYNEQSVQSILYDIYDAANEGVDSLSLGLKPIYDVLVGPQKTTEAFTSIYSFSKYLKDNNAGSAGLIDDLLLGLSGQSIVVNDIWGSGETNDAGAAISSNVLPVYTELTVGGGSKQVCSLDDYDSSGQTADSGNKLSNFRFVRFTLPSSGFYTFLVSSGSTQDIDMEIFSQGESVAFAAPGGDGDPGDASDSRFDLPAGTYSAVAYEFDNTFFSPDVDTKSGDECFTLEIQSSP